MTKALLLALLMAFSAVTPAQTRNDAEQDRTQRATARQQAVNAAAFEKRVTHERNRYNEIQDKAVVRDQIRQDKAAEQRDANLAVGVKQQADDVNDAQDLASDVTKADGITNTADIATAKAQSITDRGFMAMIMAVTILIALLVWLMIYRSGAKLQKAAEETQAAVASLLLLKQETYELLEKMMIVKQDTRSAIQKLSELTERLGIRTEMLPAHIASMSPDVVEEFNARLAAAALDAQKTDG